MSPPDDDRPVGMLPARRRRAPAAVPPHCFVLAVIAALIALLTPGVTTAAAASPSSAAQYGAKLFVKRVCDSYDTSTASMDALAEVWQYTLPKTVNKKRNEPSRRASARAELRTLAEYCKRPDIEQLRFLPTQSGREADFQFDFKQPGPKPQCVEVTIVTSTAPTDKRIAAKISEKANAGQLTSANCSEGGTLVVRISDCGASGIWGTIAAGLGLSATALASRPEVKGLEIHCGMELVALTRNAATGQMEVLSTADDDAASQVAQQTLVNAGVARSQQSTTGGIDFSSVELRYVADRGAGGLRYSLRALTGEADSALGLGTSEGASDAFFVWLALSPQQFWVNLNPTEPNRIIDPVFARSDAGRVLLLSDLVLKKIVAPLVHPGTPGGAQFWHELEALDGPRPDQACFSVRQWIVPAPATVYEDRDELYVLDSPLEVKMESEFVGGFPGGGCPPGNEAFETLKEGIYRRLILPAVEQAVNAAPAFAPLRRVYASRIAAEWVRSRHGHDRTAIGRIADSGDISRWPAVPAWNPQDVFNSYLLSIQNGESAADRPVVVNGRQYVVNTVYGGVDFSRTPKRRVVHREFLARWPKLATRVRQSLRRPVTDAQGAVWFGGQSR